MVAKQPISDQRIINCLNTNYGIKVTSLTLIPLGADIVHQYIKLIQMTSHLIL